MSFEQWEREGENEELERMINEPVEDLHSGEHLLERYGGVEVAIREEFGVDPEDGPAMLAKFREFSRSGDTLRAAQLHNLHREWKKGR